MKVFGLQAPVDRGARLASRLTAKTSPIAAQSAQPQPLPKTQDPDFIASCSRKYRSFDPIDGTYLAWDGRRYLCEYP